MTKLVKTRINALEIENAYLRRENVTLRDQFAMAALHAVMTEYTNDFKTYARMAYQIADAMLEARDDSTEN
jgi:hypothetical protein